MKRQPKAKAARQDRESVAAQIKKLRADVGMLEAYFKSTKRQHRRLNLGNGCYDPVEYWTSQVMIHAASLRCAIEGGERHNIRLADGSLLATYGGSENNRGTQPKIPIKYLTAVQNNPDSSLTAEEYKIRYMRMGKCGR